MQDHQDGIAPWMRRDATSDRQQPPPPPASTASFRDALEKPLLTLTRTFPYHVRIRTASMSTAPPGGIALLDACAVEDRPN